jgi:hypothetical protein
VGNWIPKLASNAIPEPVCWEMLKVTHRNIPIEGILKIPSLCERVFSIEKKDKRFFV